MLQRKCLSVIVFMFFAVTFSAMAEINGEIVFVDGFRVMRLWGSHEEMGYAHGYLLGAEIKELFHDYFLWVSTPGPMRTLSNPLSGNGGHSGAYQSEMEQLWPDGRFGMRHYSKF